jgi:long-subunit acyl-CoA synthetase (AMP-forming)
MGSKPLDLMDATLTLGDRVTAARVVRLLTPDGAGTSDPRLDAATIARDLTRRGLRRGDRLAVVLPNGAEFIAAFVACLQLDVAFVPLNPALSEDELRRRWLAAGVSAVLSAGGVALSVETKARPSSDAHQLPAVVFFTSGSEGNAQPVAVSGRALMHVADTHHAALGYAPGDSIVGFLPWSHAFGFTLELLMALLYEGVLRTVPAADFPERFRESPGDFLFAVPRMVERLPDSTLRCLQGGIVGGAPVRGLVRQRLQATRLRVGYGQTECAPGVTLGEPGEWALDDFLGRPVGCEVALGRGPFEDVGEVLVRGPNLAMGYLDDERLVPVVSADGWRVTGDLAAAAGDGYLFQGRKDELFKLDNGRMVNPVPLELPFDGRILLIGEGREAVQPLARGETPDSFTLPVPHLEPKLMPEDFWDACTTVTGKVSRRRAQALFYRR